jgi:D-alanyl-D-alanine carboxypeptidase
VSAKYTALDEKQKDTPEAKWLAKNCYKYGFILRYPVDKTDITGIIYEPWHYRYVGKEDAKKIMERGITLEEYLGE